MPMSTILDLNLLPLQRLDGQNLAGVPGLYMVTPPKRCARGRASDRLILYFAQVGNSPLSDAQQEQLLGRLAQIYYKTAGSVTLGMRAVADNLNQYLLDRNLRSTSSGMQSIGLLTIAVLKNERLTVGLSGPFHVFLIQAKQCQLMYDPQTAGRGLGLARSLTIRYYQHDLETNDFLILTPNPSPTWTTVTLQAAHGQGLESLRRRLSSQVDPNVKAIIIHAQAGTGKLRLLRMKPPVVMAQPTAQVKPLVDQTVEPPLEAPRVSEQTPTPIDLPTAEETGVEPEDIAFEDEAGEEVEDVVEPEDIQPEDELDFLMPLPTPTPARADMVTENEPPDEQPSLSQEEAATPSTSLPETTQPVPPTRVTKTDITPSKPSQKPVSAISSKLAGWTARITPSKEIHKMQAGLNRSWTASKKAVGNAGQRLIGGVGTILRKVLPDESLFTIPPSTMIFTLVAVAVVISTAGVAMYLQQGRAIQHLELFNEAIEAATIAETEIDPLEIRTAWETTLHFINQAEVYQITEESISLRARAQSALDQMDYIHRLNFQQAITGGLGGSLNITRLVATQRDLFMLNSNGGNVIRAKQTGIGYDIDPDFKCSQNPTFGPLVDIFPLPQGHSSNALLLVLDGHGNLMYCNSSGSPFQSSPAPPHTNWGSPNALIIDTGNIYILDPETNGVWFYREDPVNKAPFLFFDEQIPQMNEVVDFTVNQNDLYLLHEDGRITTCRYSPLSEVKTSCDDPAVYSDPRPGKQNGVRVLDARFQQIQYTNPPDPSIYLLDPINQAVYHFSLRLNFQRQFRSANTLAGDTATAFTVSPNRTIFLATGNQVYYALLP
jgi:hypothetical protein